MSGIIGVVNAGGEPVDRQLLERLTRFIAYRGPDAQDVWIQGPAGLGHTMLRTTWEAAHEHQPQSLDGQVWISADCRIDDREELIRELDSRGHTALRQATDPELILHAYAVWETDCVLHLIGDFSFGIWDGRNKRLFCARDHIGVKLLYYASTLRSLIFGNTLNSLRLHPMVTGELNEQAVGDFLLFGTNQDITTTMYRDIRRLPPSHRMVWHDGILKIDRYWTIPVDPPLLLRRREEYTEGFLTLLRTSIKDRMRTDRVSILLSGGLDSSGIAVVAKQLADHAPGTCIKAFTSVFDHLLPDRERYFAGLVAARLQIPVEIAAGDDHKFYESCPSAARPVPDPTQIVVRGPRHPLNHFGSAARHGRVVFHGEGPDNALLYEWKPWLRQRIRQGHLGALLRDVIAFPFLFGQIPFWGRIFRQVPNGGRDPEEFAPWLNLDFVARAGLRERYEASMKDCGIPIQSPAPDQSTARALPLAHASFLGTNWQSMFEGQDPGISEIPLEFRHPYLDIRMLRFLLAMPAIPWCRNKYLLRRALSPYLPREVLERPKTGLALNPEFELWKKSGLPPGLPGLDAPMPALAAFVDYSALTDAKIDSADRLAMVLRVTNLGSFLQGSSSAMYSGS